jgi:CO dehydrogenase/acetyl-CoA synthase beta subunit
MSKKLKLKVKKKEEAPAVAAAAPAVAAGPAVSVPSGEGGIKLILKNATVNIEQVILKRKE